MRVCLAVGDGLFRKGGLCWLLGPSVENKEL